LSQQGVQAFVSVAMEKKLPFAFETVFSHWQLKSDGTVESKVDLIRTMQSKGYFVVLIFVGLQTADMSILRVASRQAKGGHAVPISKLRERFPRTRKAIGHASTIADMTLMFDNSRTESQAFTLVRAQRKSHLLFDCRDASYYVGGDLRHVAGIWLRRVGGGWISKPHPPLRRQRRPRPSRSTVHR
jgi:predicted ABC-type ATPase